VILLYTDILIYLSIRCVTILFGADDGTRQACGAAPVALS
jgi:hypothetical protein